MFSRRTVVTLALLSTLTLAGAHAQTSGRGRKYKPPPPTSHIEVVVVRDVGDKPITNAAVVFHSVKDGRDEGNLEIKTNDAGKAIIDVIPTGSTVGVQVIADGFATYAGEYEIPEDSREIQIRMVRPRAQISTYVDTKGKPADRTAGVQESKQPSTPPVIQAPQPTNHTSDPNPITPVDPNATPGNSQNKTPR